MSEQNENVTAKIVEETPDGTAQSLSREAFLECVQDYFIAKFGRERVLSKELISERKQEAERERCRQ